MPQSSWIQLLFVINSHFVSLRPQFTDLVAYINYAYVMYVKYSIKIFHTAPQVAIIKDNPEKRSFVTLLLAIFCRLSKKSFVGFHMARDEDLSRLRC